MRFQGEGLVQTVAQSGTNVSDYNNTYYERSSAYELPSQLNIGLSNDWLLGNISKLTLVC
jgi:hypothetical protein